MLTDKYSLIDPKTIIIRPDRQRSEIVVEDLIQSVEKFGIINPIIITQDLVLVAGERRLTAALQLNLPRIPVRYTENLSRLELECIELEENIKRRELPWHEQVRAIERIHKLKAIDSTKWDQTDTATHIGVSPSFVSKAIQVAQVISDPKISSASSIDAAHRIVIERNKVSQAKAIDKIDQVGADLYAPEKTYSIHSKLSEVTGTFSIVHIQLGAGGIVTWNNYSHLLAETHTIVIWDNSGEMDVEGTGEDFYWVHTDNKGIPGSVKTFRDVLATAKVVLSFDAMFIKTIANVYGSPCPSEGGLSEPMLRYLFSSMVDHTSEILCVNCGTGAAMRAALSLRARRVVGIEPDKQESLIAERGCSRTVALQRSATA